MKYIIKLFFFFALTKKINFSLHYYQAINNDLDGTLLSEARSSLYDAKNAFQLSDFLQGIYHTETGEYLHDPTWLCTL